MKVFITVDVEVWPVHPGGWPRTPLQASYRCDRELAAYFIGETPHGQFGLPFQLEMLQRHGLSATFFVDSLFSYALGRPFLEEVVARIQNAGQYVALHLHPEWLTDPRCRGLPEFQGPSIASYTPATQKQLIRLGWDRLLEAGARPLSAFRAGGWGGDVGTLGALRDLGIRIDSSLNATYDHSLPSYAQRDSLQEPTEIADVIEVPVTRFTDHYTRNGRPLSVIGTSAAEMKFVLDSLVLNGRSAATMVLHGNEFVRTERLWKGKSIEPRRMVIRRFERLCAYLADNRRSFETAPLAPEHMPCGSGRETARLCRSNPVRTLCRAAEQLVAHWY